MLGSIHNFVSKGEKMKNIFMMLVVLLLCSACTKELVREDISKEKEHEMELPIGEPKDKNEDSSIEIGLNFPLSNTSEEQKRAGSLLKEIYSHSQALTLIKTQKIGFLPCILLISIHHKSEEKILVEKIKECLESGEIINQNLYEEYPSSKLPTNLEQEKWSSTLIPSPQALDKRIAKSLLLIIASFSNLKEKLIQNSMDLDKAMAEYKQLLERESVSVFSSLFENSFYKITSELFKNQFIPLIFNYKKIILPENRNPYEKPSQYSKSIHLMDHNTLDKIYRIHTEDKNIENKNLLKYIKHLDLSQLEEVIFSKINFISDTDAEVLKNAYISIYKSIQINKKLNSILWVKKYQLIISEIKDIQKIKMPTISHFKKIMEILTDLHEIRLKLSSTFHRRTKISLLEIMDEIHYLSSFIFDEKQIIQKTIHSKNETLLNKEKIKEIRKYFTNMASRKGIFSEKRNSILDKIREEKNTCNESKFIHSEDKYRCIDLFIYHANISSYKDNSYIKEINHHSIGDLLSLSREDMTILLVKLMNDILDENYSLPNIYMWNESIQNMILSKFIQNISINEEQLNSLLGKFEEIKNSLKMILSEENLNKINNKYTSYLNEIYNNMDNEALKTSQNYLNINIFKKIPEQKAIPLAIHLGAEIKKVQSMYYLLTETELPHVLKTHYIPPVLILKILKEEALFIDNKKIATINQWVHKRKINNPSQYCLSIKCQELTLDSEKRKYRKIDDMYFKKIDLRPEEIYTSIDRFIQSMLKETKDKIKREIITKLQESVYKNLKKNHTVFILAQQLIKKGDFDVESIYQDDISGYLTEHIFKEYENTIEHISEENNKTEERIPFQWEEQLYEALLSLKEENIIFSQKPIYALKFLQKKNDDTD